MPSTFKYAKTPAPPTPQLSPSHPIDPNILTVTIGVIWLGPHETGEQVMTMAGTAALAEQPIIKSIRLVDLNELPTYAKYLTDHHKITFGGEGLRPTSSGTQTRSTNESTSPKPDNSENV